jgi:serine/threonine-protein kinase
VEVPSVVGFSEQDAIATLRAEGFTPFPVEDNSDEMPEGLVVSQNPEGGTDGSPGDQVVIVVSLGPEETEPPTTEPPTTEPPTDEPTDEPTDDEPTDDEPTDDEPTDDEPTDTDIPTDAPPEE